MAKASEVGPSAQAGTIAGQPTGSGAALKRSQPAMRPASSSTTRRRRPWRCRARATSRSPTRRAVVEVGPLDRRRAGGDPAHQRLAVPLPHRVQDAAAGPARLVDGRHRGHTSRWAMATKAGAVVTRSLTTPIMPAPGRWCPERRRRRGSRGPGGGSYARQKRTVRMRRSVRLRTWLAAISGKSSPRKTPKLTGGRTVPLETCGQRGTRPGSPRSSPPRPAARSRRGEHVPHIAAGVARWLIEGSRAHGTGNRTSPPLTWSTSMGEPPAGSQDSSGLGRRRACPGRS